MLITIDTDISYAKCLILASNGKNILVQSDCDYPGFASSFGWSVRNVQKCPACGHILPFYQYPEESLTCGDCEAIETGDTVAPCCDHGETDGTVDCKRCGLTATDFIQAAGEYLEGNDGKTVEDPGYFD